MIKINVKSAFSAGWSAYMRRPWYLLGLVLAFVLLFLVCVGDAMMTALAAVLSGGYIALLLNHFRGGHIEFDDLFAVDSRWISYAFVTLIKSFFIILGFLCFIIPGVYLSIRWIFAEMLVIDQGMRPLEALRASSKMTEGNRWKLFGLTLLGTLFIIIGFVFLVVGALIAGIVLTFALIKVYEELKSVLTEVAETATPEQGSSVETVA